MALQGWVFTDSYQGRYYMVNWTATQDASTNTSRIDWWLESLGNNGYNVEAFLTVRIDGGTVYDKDTISRGYKEVIASGSKILYHNNDGDKSFEIDVLAVVTMTPTAALTGSKTFTLDRIDRNSTINWIPAFNVEDSFTIDITKSPVAKAHTIEAFIGSKLISTWNTVASDDTYQFSNSQIDEIYKAFPNSKHATLSFKLRSYSDTNGIYQIGSVSTGDAVTILTKGASCDIQSRADDLVSGIMVAGISRPTFSIINVVPSPHASIKSYNIKVKDFFDVNKSEHTSGVIPSGITQMVVEASVTDSRGNVGRATRTLTVLPYSAPKISRFEIYRSNSNGQADPSGTYIRAHIQAGVAPLTVNEVDGNSIKWNLFSKVRGTTSWTPIISSTAGAELSISRTISGYDTTESYDFKLEVIDNYNTTISLGVVSTAGYTMSWGKEGVGIGKVLEQGVLDIGGDTYINDNTIHSSKKGEFWNHKSDDISGWMTWYNNSQASAKVGILTPNDERFSIVSKYGEIEIDSKNNITLVSNGKKATFSNGVFEPVQESTFTLYNGWESTYLTAKAIKTVDGMVHLQGVLAFGSTASGTEILRLPVGMRPKVSVTMMAWTTSNSVARYDIWSDGYMTSYNESGALIYLDGMSFYVGNVEEVI